MPDQLLITKLNTPPLRRSLVSRLRLTERMNRGLAEGRRLTLISAPAGYGKTTLACDWLAAKAEGGRLEDEETGIHAASQRDAAQSFSPSPVVTWLALDDGDNDPARFFAYLVAALRKFDPGIGQETLDFARSPSLPPAPALMTPLINDIALGSKPVILVLDDLHAIRTPSIYDALDFLVQHEPPNCHLLLLTREDPPLSLPTLRGRGQMTELRTQDLRFTDDEAHAFFRATMGLELESSVVNRLELRTEGWVAGLQLAALSVQGCPPEDLDDFLAAFSGSDRYVMDYLIEQVARRLTPDLRSFMAATAILDRMNASLCDAVTGRVDSRAMLHQLDQANLFLVRLDAQGEWFRFHHLFAELLRLELGPESQAELHLRAAAWFEQIDLLPEAIQHALMGEDYARAARLVRLAAGALLRTSEFRTLLGWIDRLPTDIVLNDAELSVHRAAASFFTGDAKGAAGWLDRLESAPAAVWVAPRIRGRLLAIRAWLAVLRGDTEAARPFGTQALELMGDDAAAEAAAAATSAAAAAAFYRMAALLPLGHAQSAAGHTAGAEQTYREIATMGTRAGHTVAAVGGLLSLAFNILEQGRLREALELCQNSLRELVDRRGSPLPVARIMYLPMATALYHTNHLEDARECAVKGLEASRQLLSDNIMGGDGEAVLALSQYGLGETNAALATLREARAAAEQLGYQHVMRAFAALEADLHLREGDIAAARRWAASRCASLAEPPIAEREVEYRVYVRFLVAEGRLLEARALLHALERLARDGGRHGRLLTMLIWQAIVEHSLRNPDAALRCLAEAVRFAAPEGYLRQFLDTGGPALMGMLPKVRGLAPEFVDSVLQAGAPAAGAARETEAASRLGGSPTPPPAQLLPEPLSARELEVLALLAEGLSYRQVAEKLIVAMGTVQAHTGNIYGKLGVNNRTQALARARELHLL